MKRSIGRVREQLAPAERAEHGGTGERQNADAGLGSTQRREEHCGDEEPFRDLVEDQRRPHGHRAGAEHVRSLECEREPGAVEETVQRERGEDNRDPNVGRAAMGTRLDYGKGEVAKGTSTDRPGASLFHEVRQEPKEHQAWNDAKRRAVERCERGA
jgi:hypothetical protein